MKHPLEFISVHLRKPLFFILLGLMIIIYSVFNKLDQPLRTPVAPCGIISFELAQTFDSSQAILDSWDENARLFAAFGLGLDYLLMPVYALTLSLGLLLASREKARWYHALAAWLGWGTLLAALFDAVENYALWHILTGSVDPSFPQIAWLCATIKFTLLIAGILAVITVLAGKAVKK